MDFPIKNGDFPVRYVKLPEGIHCHEPSWNCPFDGPFPADEELDSLFVVGHLSLLVSILTGLSTLELPWD